MQTTFIGETGLSLNCLQIVNLQKMHTGKKMTRKAVSVEMFDYPNETNVSLMFHVKDLY